MDFNEQAIIDKAHKLGADRIEACAIHLVNKCRENLGKPGRTKSEKTLTRGKNKGSTKTVWGALGSAPSSPGDFPAKQTGGLRSSIAYVMDRQSLVARTGTSLRVGRWMEFGTRGGKVITPKDKAVLADSAAGIIFGKKVVQGAIAPRPWLLRTMNEEKAAMGQIISTGKTA